jgi:prepilin-type N-terminal cleavage/methylation domain-containing protein
MKHNRSKELGFTLIELLVVIVIIGILAAIALPNFIKARNKAREAEVKSNIHAIQIALERYAVDSGGVYPSFSIGAERDFNLIKGYIEKYYGGGNDVSQFPVAGVTPFALTADATKEIIPGSRIRISMDPMIQFGYLSEYPTNPFSRRDTGMWNASRIANSGMTGIFPYGGYHGDKMFDVGFGWGDTPQTDFVLYTTEAIEENESKADPDNVFSDPDLDSPGNFYYHPIFNDMIPVYAHYAANYGAVIDPGAVNWASIGISSDECAGYLLYGYGAAGDRDSLVEGGLDYFNRMPEKNDLPDEAADFVVDFYGIETLDTGVGAGDQMGGTPLQLRVETTGYPSQEFDPWTGAFADGIDPNNPGVIDQERKSGADGILDWVIIEVSSGVDIKSDTVKDQLQFAT